MKRVFFIFYSTMLFIISALLPGAISAQESSKAVSFEGTGAVIERNNGRIIITGIFKGSPAEGKLEVNDQILDIYGESTKLMTVNEVLSRIERPAGIPLKLIVLRNRKHVTVDLSTASYPITPKTVPAFKDVQYNAKILGFQSRDFLDVRFIGTRLKYGDTFFIFNNDELMALARVRNVSGDSASMKVIRFYQEMKNHESYRYTLAFYGYFPEIFKIEPVASPTPKNTDTALLRVKIVNYEINQTPENKIRALVTLQNTGNVTASKIFANCVFSDRTGRFRSTCNENVDDLKPDSKYVMELIFKFDQVPGYTLETDGQQLKARPEGSQTLPALLTLKMEIKCYSEDGDIYIFKETF